MSFNLMEYAGDTQNENLLRGPAPVPEGYYNVAISKAETKIDEKNGTHMVLFRFSILDGPHRGRTVGAVMTLNNPQNKDREESSRRDFARLNVAVNGPVSDANLYLGRQLMVKVVVGKAASGDMENYIRNFHPLGYDPQTKTVVAPPSTPPANHGQYGPPPAQYQPNPQQQTPPGGAQNPWQRR